jgi:anti-sigma factor RsiW
MRIRFPRPFAFLRPRVPDLVCQQVVELVTDYLEGALSEADRQRFDKHLVGCPHCTEYLAQMRETIRLSGRLTPEDLTPVMRSDLTDLFHRWQAEG